MTATGNQQAMLSALPDLLRKQAVDLSGEGSDEYVFPAACSCEVFDSLEHAGIRVLGGDLWASSRHGYAAAHDGWYTASGGTASNRRDEWENFISRLSQGGNQYVTSVV